MKRLHSLYVRLLALLIALALLPLVVLSGIGYRFFSDLMVETIAESNLHTLRQVENKIEEIYAELDDIMMRTSVHPDIQSILTDGAASEWEAYRDVRFFVDFTRLMMIGNPEIDTITLYNVQGKRMDSQGRFLDTPYSSAPPAYADLVEQLKNGAEPTAVSPVYEHAGKPWMSFGRTVRDLNTGRLIGSLIVDLDLQVLQAELRKVNLLKSGHVVLLGEGAQIIYHPDGMTGQELRASWLQAGASGSYYLEERDGVPFLFLRMEAQPMGWTIYGIVPYSDIEAELAGIRSLFYWCVFIIAALVALVAFALRRLFVRPILKLRQLMRRVQSGDYFVRAHSGRRDEIGDLADSFNNMVTRIEELIETVYKVQLSESRALLVQKQAELEALQAHMTPHFLYNTLNAIGWHANRRGFRDIQAVVDSLAGLLRYSLNNTSRLVRLAEEFDCLRLYMDIIRFRHAGRIEVVFDLPDELRDVPLPRLILQPIAENAVRHAFEEMTGAERIRVAARRDGDDVRIELDDNGRGMSDEALRRLAERLKSPLRGENLASYTGSGVGLGLVNVHHRLQLSFGERYGLRLSGEEGRGTRVALNLPLQAGGDAAKSNLC